MDQIKEFLFFKIIEIKDLDFQFAPINIILIALILIGVIVLARLSKRWVKTISSKSSKIERKSEILQKLFRQLIYIVGVVLFIQSFSINNDHINFESFLELEIFGVNKFSLRVYTLVLAFILFFVSKLFLNLFKLYLHRNLAKREWVDEGKEFTIFQLVKYIVYFIVIITIIKSTGVDMNLLVTSSAALFVAIGLGLQSIFADFVSGFILLFDGSVKVGDVVVVDDRVVKLSKINIRTSQAKTRDKTVIIIPNSKLTSNNVENWSQDGRLTRFNIRISVAYGSDTQQVKQLLLDSLKVSDNISHLKTPEVWFQDFGASGLHFDLFFWAERTFGIEKDKSEIRFEIDRLFRANEIQIPFPQTEITLKR